MHGDFVGFLLHLPLIIQVGCIVLVVGALCFAVRLHWFTSKLLKQIKSLRDRLQAQSHRERDHNSGISEDEWDGLRNQMQHLREDASAWWRRISSSVELYPGGANQESYFLVESADDILPYESLVKKSINVSFYRGLPGLLTGAGLALTFVAILLALYGVHYEKSNTIEPISGIDILINGLSGKFTSSVVALLLSIVFTLYEQLRMRAVRDSTVRCIALQCTRQGLSVRAHTVEETYTIPGKSGT
jgi:hypothetical protein